MELKLTEEQLAEFAKRSQAYPLHVNDVADLLSDLATAKAEVERLMAVADDMAAALGELHDVVWGECPSILNEDSGGCARLDLAVSDALAKYRQLKGTPND